MGGRDLSASVIRTLTPIVAGVVLGAAARLGLDLDEGVVADHVEVIIAAAYFALFRAVEAWAGRMSWGRLESLAGVLLGWARPPRYGPDAEDVVVIRLKLDSEYLADQLKAATVQVEEATGEAVGRP